MQQPTDAPSGPPSAVVLGFPEGTVVDVEQIDDVNWRLLKELDYRGNRDLFQVPAGQGTDFASVPRVFVWFLPRYGRYTKAAVLHDYLWRVRVPAGMKRIDADGLFRHAMRELGVTFLRRWIMWAAVRWGALTKPDGRKDWWKEAPRVLLVTVPALPILLPPAMLVAGSLVAFYVVEVIVWVPLKIGHVIQVKRGKPAKKVNTPHLRWKL